MIGHVNIPDVQVVTSSKQAMEGRHVLWKLSETPPPSTPASDPDTQIVTTISPTDLYFPAIDPRPGTSIILVVPEGNQNGSVFWQGQSDDNALQGDSSGGFCE